MTIECPECGEPLEVNDFFGPIVRAEHYWEYPQSWIDKKGTIFKCTNEDCPSSVFNFYFYSYDHDPFDLKKGYPC